ncbi:MAG: short-chain dehydrogenase/reductase [Elusimicrobia bacterium RIFOXYA12_FULL_51_18]|nr:MAG: short-chain dehydrogenase/reductase [Elusimicrobia bacterium RIFOXYA12_FULL_51_18]OGS28806.1 MAG: short-chain dehydrogenase/reductase [Elusimicrobia bacterium RIFOXYA2_FULL_53_38]
MNNVVLITGASSGIGKATAKILIANGYKVYAGARRVEKLKELEYLGARITPLDVTDEGSLKKAVETVVESEGRLDILINNAGYGANGAIEDVPMSEARRQFDVNLFGLARLTQLVLPVMRKQGSGKIINISSIAGKINMPLGGWYHATKHALEAYSDALRLEVYRFGIKVILIEPGAIKTEWDTVALVNLMKYSGSGPYADLTDKLTNKFRAAYRKGAPGPEVVAKTILKALRSRWPAARYAAPFQAKVMLFLKRLTPDCVLDAAIKFLLK